ncbi:hypothetical protein (Partial), partial [Seminavis robusta]
HVEDDALDEAPEMMCRPTEQPNPASDEPPPTRAKSGKKKKREKWCSMPNCGKQKAGKLKDDTVLCSEHYLQHRAQQPQSWTTPPPRTCRHTECNFPAEPHQDRQLLCELHRFDYTVDKAKKEQARTEMEANAFVIRVRKKMEKPEEREAQCERLRSMKALQDGSYIPTNLPAKLRKLPNHRFSNIQFHNEQVLQLMMKGNDAQLDENFKTDKSQIDVLGNEEMGLLVDQSIPYDKDSFVANIAEDSRKRYLEHRDPKLREELLEIALAAHINLSVPGDDDKAPALFNAAEYHRGNSSAKIQYFPHHKDKNCFTMVSIYVVEGESFNFVIVPGGPDEGPDFDTEHGDYGEYDDWKGTLGVEDLKNVELYENALKDKRNQFYTKGHHSIVVYKLTPGQRLIFKAQWLTHGVIVPGNQQRSVIIFHDLLPKWSTFRAVKKLKSSRAAKKGRDEPTKGTASTSRASARARSKRGAAKKKEAMTTSSATSSGNKAKRSRKRKY